MAACRHCGKPIVRTRWYDGPGWRHEDQILGRWCPPKTQAEPVEATDD